MTAVVGDAGTHDAVPDESSQVESNPDVERVRSLDSKLRDELHDLAQHISELKDETGNYEQLSRLETSVFASFADIWMTFQFLNALEREKTWRANPNTMQYQ